MTTVACDGKTIAADTLSVDSWGLKNFASKLFMCEGFVVAGAGDVWRITKWARAVRDLTFHEALAYGYPGFNKDDSPTLLVARANELWRMDGEIFRLCERGYHALGTGRDFALAAMHMGGDAVSAVQLAMLFDNNTGGAIETMQLPERL